VNKSQDNKGDYMQKSKGQEEHLEPQKKLKNKEKKKAAE
jgi:hypothetical protein